MLEVFKFCKTREVKSPVRGTDEAAGIDFFIPTNLTKDIMDEKLNTIGTKPELIYNGNGHGYLVDIILHPNESILIPSGIHITLPKGYCLKFDNKSGIASKKQIIFLANCVDSDYEGEIHINLINVGKKVVTISAGDKIIQGIIYKIELPKFEEFTTLEELYKDKKSLRGAGGFGSTGTK